MPTNNKRILYIISLVVIIIITFSSFYIFKNITEQEQRTGSNSTFKQIQVVTTIYPIYEFTRQVAGDLINVTNITPNGVEPHDYEPSPQQIAKIYQNQLMIFNGSAVDPWAEKLESDLRGKGVPTVNLSYEVNSDLIKTGQNNEIDPHFWLDPVIAQKEVDIIAKKLGDIDQKNSQTYLTNAKNYNAKLADLNTEYSSLLSNCSQKTIVTSHNAFSYLSKRYGFEIVTIAGFDPESEPSSQQIAEIIKITKDKNIKYIAFETLASPKLSQTIANEADAQTIVLNPIEGLTQEDQQNQQDYISISKDNLTSLRSMLECK